MFWSKDRREYEINAVSLREGLRRHDCVTHIGNNRQGWRLSRLSAIDRIESGWEAFYTVHPQTGVRSYLAICKGETHWPYLRTRFADMWSDGLLALDICDKNCQLLA